MCWPVGSRDPGVLFLLPMRTVTADVAGPCHNVPPYGI